MTNQELIKILSGMLKVPAGFSDLFGFRRSDGKAFFLEIKTETGYPSEKQKQFIERMQKNGALAGIARSIEDARRIING